MDCPAWKGVHLVSVEKLGNDTVSPERLKELEAWQLEQKIEWRRKNIRRVITWGGELIAPPEFHGAWIEVKYDEGLIFDFGKAVDFEKVKELILALGNTLSLLTSDMDCCSPYIIEIDDNGYCHLLLCTKLNQKEQAYTKPYTMDMILRKGTEREIKVGGD